MFLGAEQARTAVQVCGQEGATLQAARLPASALKTERCELWSAGVYWSAHCKAQLDRDEFRNGE
eukprot:406743-Pleurochrysis_carterae.AAC.1